MKQIYLCSRLMDRVTFQEEDRTPDDSGGYSVDWADVATVWAEVVPLNNGGETLQIAQLATRKTYRITVRYRDDIDETMRISWSSRLLNIRSVTDPDNHGESLEIIAEEGVAS